MCVGVCPGVLYVVMVLCVVFERWGFDYGDRNTFEPIKESYEGTLLWDFYHHDPVNGPLKSFEL